MNDFPERDWKLLRELKPVTLERLCERILHSAAKITTAPGLTNHERYIQLWKLIQDQNDEIALAFDDHRRSTAFLKILQIHRSGLFTDQEFARFSDQTRKHVLDVEAL
jgi:hypothetical protein